jgi:adenine-specific DNA-methyltransferase
MLGKDLMTQYYSVPFVSLFDTSNCHIRLTSAQEMGISIENILDRIRTNERLGEVCHINQGVVSGCDFVSSKESLKFKNLHQGDGIFVLDMLQERDIRKIETFNDNEKELLKPFFKNSDISRYWSKSNPDKLLLYFKGKLDEDRFPNVLEHLKEFQLILEERLVRYEEKYHWTSLHRSRDETIFTSSKIVVPYRSCQNTFAYNETDWFCRSDCYIITQKDPSLSLKYLLALLNSKLNYVWLYHRGKRKGNTLELFNTPLSAIPIKRISPNDQNEFINLVDEIMKGKSENPNNNTSETEHMVDRLVYDLYCLTEEEIRLVEQFYV